MKTIKKIGENFRHGVQTIYIETRHEMGMMDDWTYARRAATETITHKANLAHINYPHIPIIGINDILGEVNNVLDAIGDVTDFEDSCF